MITNGCPTIEYAETRDRTGDLQIFSLTLSQLSYRGSAINACFICVMISIGRVM